MIAAIPKREREGDKERETEKKTEMGFGIKRWTQLRDLEETLARWRKEI